MSISKQDPAARRAAYFASQHAEAKRIAAEQRRQAAADKWQSEREARWSLSEFVREFQQQSVQS